MADTEERSWRNGSGTSDPGKGAPAEDDGGTTSKRAATETSEDDGTRELRTDRTQTPTERRTPFTQQVGRAIMAIAAVLFGVFAVANVDSVTFNWIFGEGQVPLILLLVVSFGFGALIAWLATMRHGGRH